jgi:hypothetical protein
MEFESVHRERVLKELYGGMWHTTHPDRFKSILFTGAILPEPDIPDKDRWKTSLGKNYYPYVRTLGGVSLFDFDEFDPDSYAARCPVSTWAEFVPYRTEWGRSVWIEIDREQVASQIISGSNLVAKWKSDDAYRHSIMPYIEAAHLGPLPQTAFKRAFLVCREDTEFHTLRW